jgi:hypothetical protein
MCPLPVGPSNDLADKLRAGAECPTVSFIGLLDAVTALQGKVPR